ncbi:hypothetical protein HPB52_005412 [Rhipicephalus sanguineus]|uniref:Tick transposon n=1 Tax=Rhipicephalus sanguineus TaxID=34632 RepID=A0A9D4QGH9_RHISA|nr:hypothetical protein HPB52_005412 [Rhipicephalus sanguineus]
MTEASTERWRTSAAKKRSLQLYLKYKLAPDCEPFYRGDRESALLFQARTGSLNTQQRRWELFDADPSCRLCGATEETIQHIMMDCPRLGARAHPTLSLAEYLGLSDDSVDTRVEHNESAKRRLKLWDCAGKCTNTPTESSAATAWRRARRADSTTLARR